MISILTNISATISMGQLAFHQRALNSSMEHLATGQRINKASDDPAGSAAGESLAAEIISVKKQMDGYVFEEKRLGAVDGAQSVLSDLLTELSGLIPQSANTGGLSPKEREANQVEVDSILQTIDHLATTTRFDGQLIISHMTSGAMGLSELRTGGKQNLVDGDLEAAQKTVDDAIQSLGIDQAGAGTRGQAIEHELNALEVKYESLTEAHSLVMDTDYAAETARFVRESTLRDAAQFMTKMALTQNRDLVLKLLQPLGVKAA